MNQPKLTKEAGYFLLENPDLLVEAAKMTGISYAGVTSAAKRRSTTLTTYHLVMLLSRRMYLPPEKIVEITEKQ